MSEDIKLQFAEEFKLLYDAVAKTETFPDGLIDELRTYEYHLSSDPTSVTLSELHKTLAALSNAKVRVSNIYFDSLAILGQWQDLETAGENLWNECFAFCLQKLEIASLKSDKLRVAAVESAVPEIVKLRNQITREVQHLERVTKLCKLRLDSLVDTGDSLSRQITVIDLQLKIGEISIRRS